MEDVRARRSCGAGWSHELPLPARSVALRPVRAAGRCCTSSRCAGASGRSRACSLWSTSIRDREASTFFQRLHRDPLLLLQLLALLALALALARPVATVIGQGARKVVVVLDTSASMKAQDVSPSRFEVARAGAAALVRGLGEGAEVMVIEAGVQPKVTAAMAPRPRAGARGHRAGGAARPADAARRGGADRPGSSSPRDPRAEIHVFTDGAFTLPQSEDTTDPRVRWIGVARQGGNVAITSLSIRKNYYGAFDYQAFVSLVNHSSEAQTFTFRLELDDKSIAEKRSRSSRTFAARWCCPSATAGRHRDGADPTSTTTWRSDNVAYAVLPPPRKIAVLLVSPGNLFLEKVLRTDPQVSLDVRTPDQYQGGMGDADVVVLDSVTPPRAGPGRFVFVNAVPPDVPIEVLGRIERPTIMDWDRSHPVMRHVEFAKVTIEDAMRIRPLAAGRPVVEAVGGPLIYALEEPDRKALFVGFDLFKTDFPLRIAFPLVLSNTLRWLHPAGLDQSSFQFAAGQPILLPVAARRQHGHGDHAQRPNSAGPGHARRHQLHRDRRGRHLHPGDGARRDAGGREPHELRRIEPRAARRCRPRPARRPRRRRSRSARPLAALRHAGGVPARGRGVALLAAPERGPAAPAVEHGRPLGARAAERARRRALPHAAAAGAAALGRPHERRVPARPVGQREPRLARARLSIRRRVGQVDEERRPQQRDRVRRAGGRRPAARTRVR